MTAAVLRFPGRRRISVMTKIQNMSPVTPDERARCLLLGIIERAVGRCFINPEGPHTRRRVEQISSEVLAALLLPGTDELLWDAWGDPVLLLADLAGLLPMV